MEIVVNDEKLLFIMVSKHEAIRIINSLSSQIIAKNPNVGMGETYATNGVDVSISVEMIDHEKTVKNPSCFGKKLDVESCNHGCPVSDECYM